MTTYRCIDCRPTWMTTDPDKARKHGARFGCLVHPDPGRTPTKPKPQLKPDPSPDQLALDI
jgi:hypothetical protein